MQEELNSRVSLFGFEFDNVTLQQAAHRVLELTERPEVGHYVVTPNLDHAVILNKRPELADVYRSAALVVADGSPLIWASRWLQRPISERVQVHSAWSLPPLPPVTLTRVICWVRWEGHLEAGAHHRLDCSR